MARDPPDEGRSVRFTRPDGAVTASTQQRVIPALAGPRLEADLRAASAARHPGGGDVCDQPELPYPRLLAVAYELGRADGHLARDLRADGDRGRNDARPSDRCRGRAPREFAALLWADRPSPPPAGLEVNAPPWYAAGFRDGLAAPAPELPRQEGSRAPSSPSRLSRRRR
jgi:hypothetical protein